MLIEKKIKLNETKRQKANVDISGASATYDEGVVTVTAPNHKIVPGTNVYFSRACGDGETFIQKFNVFEADKDSFKIRYELDNFVITPELIHKESVKITPFRGVEDFLVLTFNRNNKHICCKNRGEVNITQFYDSGYTFGASAETCVRTYDALFNDVTYYRVNKNDSDGNKVLETPLNVMDHYVWFVDESGVTHSTFAFIPFSPSGYDNRTLMYLYWTNSIEELYENFDFKTFFCFDCRFFNLDGIISLTSGDTFEFNEGTEVYTYPAYLNIHFGTSDEFKLNLTHEDDVKTYVDDRLYDNVSDIIDFEKRMFEPTYIETKTPFALKDLKSIRFNVFLRDRVYDSETGDWYAPDEKYWYSLDKGAKRAVFKTDLLNDKKGDLLGSMGFEDDDVINQSQRLNKTFIRLSLYDTTNRATQTLLYYATMFINTSKQYAKYMRDVASNVKMNDSTGGGNPAYVRTVNVNDDLALCCNFTSYDKYNMSGSSEGFYLYLFPDIVEGAEEKELYMKVELNHAKYGKTIPLVYPRNEYGVPTTPRIHYWVKDRERGNYVNLDQLYKDMYIKVRVKRDYENNRYIWYLPDQIGNNEIQLNLYEPRINPSQTELRNGQYN